MYRQKSLEFKNSEIFQSFANYLESQFLLE